MLSTYAASVLCLQNFKNLASNSNLESAITSCHKSNTSGTSSARRAFPRMLTRWQPLYMPLHHKMSRSFKVSLGLVNFYRRFLTNLVALFRPLHLLLWDGNKWERRQEQLDAFTACKHLGTSAPVLVHFQSGKPVCLSCDVSPYCIAAVPAHKDADD